MTVVGLYASSHAVQVLYNVYEITRTTTGTDRQSLYELAVFLLQRKNERPMSVQPEKEKTPGRPHFSLSILKEGL